MPCSGQARRVACVEAGGEHRCTPRFNSKGLRGGRDAREEGGVEAWVAVGRLVQRAGLMCGSGMAWGPRRVLRLPMG